MKKLTKPKTNAKGCCPAAKPKAEKAKAHASAYKLSQVKGPQSVIVPPAKKS